MRNQTNIRMTKETKKILDELKSYMKETSFSSVSNSDVVEYALKQLYKNVLILKKG